MYLLRNLCNVQYGIKARILAVRVHSIAMTKEVIVTVPRLVVGVSVCVQIHNWFVQLDFCVLTQMQWGFVLIFT